MSFKHACFISYRHGQGELVSDFLDQFTNALESELKMHLAEDIYLDQQRLHAGTILNPSLALALCESVCMIMIYTPRYFASDSTYCIREFLAMQAVESQRTQLVKAPTQKSFIIPVVLRGNENFPNQIFGQSPVIYADFSRFTLSDRKIIRNTVHYAEVKKIANHIVSMFHLLSSKQPCKDCAQMDFPNESAALSWLQTNFGPSKESFPFRNY